MLVAAGALLLPSAHGERSENTAPQGDQIEGRPARGNETGCDALSYGRDAELPRVLVGILECGVGAIDRSRAARPFRLTRRGISARWRTRSTLSASSFQSTTSSIRTPINRRSKPGSTKRISTNSAKSRIRYSISRRRAWRPAGRGRASWCWPGTRDPLGTLYAAARTSIGSTRRNSGNCLRWARPVRNARPSARSRTTT